MSVRAFLCGVCGFSPCLVSFLLTKTYWSGLRRAHCVAVRVTYAAPPDPIISLYIFNLTVTIKFLSFPLLESTEIIKYSNIINTSGHNMVTTTLQQLKCHLHNHLFNNNHNIRFSKSRKITLTKLEIKLLSYI